MLLPSVAALLSTMAVFPLYKQCDQRWADEPTWIDVYDDGSAADGPVSQQYLFSFWWAITTLAAQNPIPYAIE